MRLMGVNILIVCFRCSGFTSLCRFDAGGCMKIKCCICVQEDAADYSEVSVLFCSGPEIVETF